MSRVPKFGIAALVAAFLLYLAIYAYGSNSEAFRFSQSWLEQSEQVRAAVGENRHYRLSPWGGFRQNFAGDDKRVWLDLRVSGDKGAITFRLELSKVNGSWTVVNSGIV